MYERSTKLSEKHAMSVIVWLPLGVFLWLFFFEHFNGLYGQDSHEYFRYSNVLVTFFKGGGTPDDYFWPVNYPLYGAILSFVFYSTSFTMPFLSSLSFCGTIFYTSKLIRHLYPEAKYVSLFLFLSLFLSPAMVNAGIVVMSDMLTVFLFIAGFYYALLYLNYNRRWQIYASTFLFCSAFMTRYAVAVLIFLPALIIVFRLIRDKKYIQILVSLLICMFCFLPHILLRQYNSINFLQQQLFTEWSFYNFFKTHFVISSGQFNYLTANIIHGFYNFIYPTYLFFGIVLLPFVRFNKMKILLVFIILLYAFFLAGLPYQNNRYLLLSFPLVVVILYPSFEKIYDFVNPKKVVLYIGILITVCLQFYLIFRVVNPIMMRNKLEQSVAAFINQYPDKIVYGFDLDISLPSYNVKNKIVNLWYKPITDYKRGSLVIFNEQALQQQWEGKKPMINWNFLKKSYQLQVIQSFDAGWNVYKIE